MAFVCGPEALHDPIATNNNRQCAKSAYGNGVPDVDTALIGSERREDCEASEKMRVPSKRVISQCASGLGQNHRETNECERLPKLRDFEPDEQTEETAPCNGEEAANGALVAIVAQSRQLGREIERCRENRKSHQPQAHVSMLRRFEMKIEDHAPIGGERSEQGVLYLQVRRLESAAKSRNDEHYGEKANPAKNDFFHNHASDEKNFSTNEPKDGHVVRLVRVMGWSSRQHESSSRDSEDDERFPSALGGRDLRTKEFSGTDYEKGDVGKLRLNRLEFHAAQQQPHVQDRGDSGDVFLEVGFDVTGYVGNAEGQPVEEKQSQAGAVFREVTAVSPFDTEDAEKPIEMIQVAGENAEYFKLEPTHFQDNGNKTDGKDRAGSQTVHGVLTQRDGRVTQQKRQAGDELRAISQSVSGHRDRDDQHQDAIESQGIENTHWCDMMNRVGTEKKQRPPAADAGAAKEAIAFVLFQIDAAHK